MDPATVRADKAGVTRTAVRLTAAVAILASGFAAMAVAARAQAGSPVIRGPYLQLATPTSLVVRWRTTTASDSVVRYGIEPGQLTSTATTVSAGATTEHAVRLSGLTPHTRYFYAVGTSSAMLAGGDLDHSFVTSPVPGSRVPTRLWVLGDSGTADANARRVRDAFADRARERDADVWLMLGDNAYTTGTDGQYQAAVFDMYPRTLARTALWSTFGNHDALSADSPTQSGPYYDLFTLPTQGEAGGEPSGTEAYYSFDYANIHFICLDSSDTSLAPSGPMLQWLRRDLARPRAEWTIAFFHHAPYSKGSHDSDVEHPLVDVRQNVAPLLETAGVDLVLAGHSHSYERSYLLNGHYGVSSTLLPSSIVDAGSGAPETGAYRKVRGTAATVYVTAGSSGQIAGGPLNHPAMARSLNLLGSLVIDVDGPRLVLTFLDGDGAPSDRLELDSHEATGVPAAPERLRVRESGSSLSLQWDGPAGGGRPQGYVVEAGVTPGGRELGSAPTGSLAPALVAQAPPGRYVARVRAVNAAGQSGPTNEVPIVVAPARESPPPAPEALRADVAGTTVSLRWDALPAPWGATTYVVSAGDTPGSARLGALPVSGSAVSLPGVPAGVYYLRVQAVAAGGPGAASPDVQVVVGGVPSSPAPPGLPRAQVVGSTLQLTWAPPWQGSVSDAYVIEAGASATDFTLGRLRTGSAAPTLSLPGVPSGTYFVRVRGANALGDGLPSPPARVVVP